MHEDKTNQEQSLDELQVDPAAMDTQYPVFPGPDYSQLHQQPYYNRHKSEDLHSVISEETSTDINSIVESLVTQRSSDSSFGHERRIQQRRKQIDHGKSTTGYLNYIRTVCR